MGIIVDNDTRLVVQGLTGSEGRFHGLRNRNYGTQVVAGVTPGKAGQDVGVHLEAHVVEVLDDVPRRELGHPVVVHHVDVVVVVAAAGEGDP